ncbi:MAG: hypothetical protein HYU78_18220 [Rhodocyclales bacterium]|nr:hypothetical protein [Rhodocyclales bacterium]
MLKHFPAGLLLTCGMLAASSSAIGQQKLDIVQIMGQFIQAKHAAGKCLPPDPDTLRRFASNFRIVTIRATEEMRKRNPSASEQQIAEAFQKGADAVGKQIDGVVSSSGCADPRIQDLLKRFEIQANLKF